MVDLHQGLSKLPPGERLKRLRLMEEETRKRLEEELSKRKEELEKLEAETKLELEEAQELEDETLKEIARERADLEERLKEFRQGDDFLPEEGEAPGFGQSQPGQYDSQLIQRAEEELGYLLNAKPASPERATEVQRDLYQSMRSLQEQMAGGQAVDEGSIYNMRKAAEQLNESGDQFGYVARIKNVLNDIIDYKRQDEERRNA